MTDYTKLLALLALYKDRILGAQDEMLVYVRDSMLPSMERMVGFARDTTGPTAARLNQKLHRWLGFAQGVLWVRGVYTVEDLREQTRGIDLELP